MMIIIIRTRTLTLSLFGVELPKSILIFHNKTLHVIVSASTAKILSTNIGETNGTLNFKTHIRIKKMIILN